MLYWYKSANTDAEGRQKVGKAYPQVLSLLALLVQRWPATGPSESVSAGAQFACFTGTKVQILTQKVGRGREVELLWALASGGEGGGGGGGCGCKVGGVARAGRALMEP